MYLLEMFDNTTHPDRVQIFYAWYTLTAYIFSNRSANASNFVAFSKTIHVRNIWQAGFAEI